MNLGLRATATALAAVAALAVPVPTQASTSTPKPALPHPPGLRQHTEYTKPAPVALPDGRRVAPKQASPSGLGSYIGAYGWDVKITGGCLTARGNISGYQAYTDYCGDRTDQLWDMYEVDGAGFPGHWYKFVNRYNGLCLDADANNITHNGDRVQTWTCLDAQQNQRWGTSSIATALWGPIYNLTGYRDVMLGIGTADALDADLNYAGSQQWPVQLWHDLGSSQRNQQWLW
ncbi:RICIN domain-containing protein [Actinomadura rupiterrae]|uniref:RICIN domain-containing protein n=1 Tax=Actinomadura rupiterrae TaxID=559627 RepID=UPI0020A49347|nr:RICIN domain-containing protein [Actinomadura rupiterrae]MCP2337388.1 hypothetical protein [Actinomadura rupiterrae]